jgi:hypothetical protein
MESMSFWLLYFLPSIIAWVRLRRGKPVCGSFGQLFFFNLIAGITVVGWILPMLNAFGYNPVPWMAMTYLKVFGVTRPVNTPQSGFGAPQGGSSGSPQGQVCGHCGGSGSMTCPQCQGSPSLMQSCFYCSRSGRVQCQYQHH